MTHRWLGLALYAEGADDHRFLESLLRRSVEHVLLSGGHSVEVSPIQRLATSDKIRSRGDRIADGAERSQGAFHILFVHADADGDTERARIERVQPGIDAMHERLGSDARCGVPVVPIRETEAWALADYERLCEILGTAASPDELGLPRSPDALERERDPKALFESVVQIARSGRRGRRRPKAASFLDLLGESVRIEECARLAAFATFLSELADALTHLGFRD